MEKTFYLIIGCLALATVWGANLEDQSVSSNPLTTKELSQNKSDVSQSDNSTTAKPPLPTTVKPIPSTTANPPPPPTTISPITTAVPSTTTAAPDVHPGVWNVSTNGTNCILAKMAIDFSVNYNDTNNKTNVAHFTVSSKSAASGECGKMYQTLHLPFSNNSGNINFTFSDNATNKDYYLSYIIVEIPVSNLTFPNNTWSNVSKLDFTLNGALFKSSMNMSYTCAAPDAISFKNDKNVTSSLKLSGIQLEAFGTHKDKSFSTGVDCVTGETPDIVPIAVGLALALLVIVVLIGFLVSRRRSQARGYLSM